MIIHTHVDISTLLSKKDNEVIEKTNEEVIVKPVVREKRKKSTPIVIEEPIVVEEKIEDEDLSQWLKEHTED